LAAVDDGGGSAVSWIKLCELVAELSKVEEEKEEEASSENEEDCDLEGGNKESVNCSGLASLVVVTWAGARVELSSQSG
jgi:hypothetical protein